MQKITIAPGARQGTMAVPPAKSVLHRRIITAALSKGLTVFELNGFPLNADNLHTLRAVEEMGLATVQVAPGQVAISGAGSRHPVTPTIYCGASASTLRFLLPLALLKCRGARFCGEKRLFERPQQPYLDLFRERSAVIKTGDDYLLIGGELVAGDYLLPGDISSQFASGLLFSLPLLAAPSRIHFSSELESAPYLALTLEALAQAGVQIEQTSEGFIIPGNQSYHLSHQPIDGDFSYAANFLTLGALGGPISLTGLSMDSKQGDREILAILQQFGATVDASGGMITVQQNVRRAFDCDLRHIPDLMPILAVLAAAAEGVSRLHHAARLRGKESDRLAVMTAELRKLGADIEEYPDALVIQGHGGLRGGEVDSHHDHRIAFALAMAAAITDSPLTICGADCVEKSAPGFWQQLAELSLAD